MKIFDFQQVIHHLLSLKKKSSPTAAVIVAFTVFEIKKLNILWNKNIFPIQRPSIIKKKLDETKWRGVEKKINILLKNLMVFGLDKLNFPFNHKTGGLLYRKTNTQ